MSATINHYSTRQGRRGPGPVKKCFCIVHSQFTCVPLMWRCSGKWPFELKRDLSGLRLRPLRLGWRSHSGQCAAATTLLPSSLTTNAGDTSLCGTRKPAAARRRGSGSASASSLGCSCARVLATARPGGLSPRECVAHEHIETLPLPLLLLLLPRRLRLLHRGCYCARASYTCATAIPGPGSLRTRRRRTTAAVCVSCGSSTDGNTGNSSGAWGAGRQLQPQ